MLELVDKNIKRVTTVFNILKKLRHERYFLKDPNRAARDENCNVRDEITLNRINSK